MACERVPEPEEGEIPQETPELVLSLATEAFKVREPPAVTDVGLLAMETEILGELEPSHPTRKTKRGATNVRRVARIACWCINAFPLCLVRDGWNCATEQG